MATTVNTRRLSRKTKPTDGELPAYSSLRSPSSAIFHFWKGRSEYVSVIKHATAHTHYLAYRQNEKTDTHNFYDATHHEPRFHLIRDKILPHT